ncbi:MAG TPA: hypothetical protein VHO29_17480 [Marmoricola sp.]|nr:hypothetical protein [Marmoricola sp.]
MRTVTHPRGRLPARVYWFRRLMVLFTAFALVFAVGRLLTGSGGGGTPPDTARVTASSPSATASHGVAGPVPIQPATTATATRPAPPSATGTPVVLAAPSGPCALDEITVTPTVPTAVAGKPVDLVLQLSGIKPACTFTVSSDTIVAKVTSGNDRIWSSQDCPASIKRSSTVVRSAAPTTVTVAWSGRRSDQQCSRSAPWALPGYYHLTASVIGSEPNDAQFRLTSPPRPVITKTAKPHTKKKGNGTVCGGDIAAGSC